MPKDFSIERVRNGFICTQSRIWSVETTVFRTLSEVIAKIKEIFDGFGGEDGTI